MSVARVNPLLPDAGSQGSARAAVEPGADFAAVARSVAAGDLQAAQKALAATGATATATQTLAQTLAEGNLAAARLALAQLGVDPFGAQQTHPSGRDVAVDPAPPPPGPAAPVPTSYVPSHPDMTIGAPAQPPQPGNGMVVADVGATLANTAPATSSSSGGTVTSANGSTYQVADVMLALALGSAGSIPADVINLYGPGGARYDPAAIMDAYRNSDLGKAQIAALSWIGRPA